MTYDSLGRMTRTTDAKGKTTMYDYDAMGRIIFLTDPVGNVTNYFYYPDGKLAQVTDAKDHDIRYEYDSRGRLIEMTDQLGNIETYSYDTSDNLVSMTDRQGQTTSYQYDLMNRLIKVVIPAEAGIQNFIEYTYDAGGRLMSVSNSVSGSIQYTYTGAGCGTGCSSVPDKVASETTPLGSISYSYDAIGRRTSMTVAGQEPIYYTYDAGGRLVGISTLNSQLGTLNFSIAYDALGRRTSLTLPNGVTTNYSYDTAGHLSKVEHLNSASTVLDSVSYAFDGVGNRTAMIRPSVTLPMPKIASNITYNDSNQMITFNDKNITYDANGNMITVTNGCGTMTYTWDKRNRLVGINGFNTDCSSLTASFKYDAFGRRIEKTINGKTIHYLYDDGDIVQELENGEAIVNYIRTLNIDEPLARINSDGFVAYYQADGSNSIIALTDRIGTVKTRYAYDPFGNVVVSGESSDNPFQYTGRENDNTGLYYYRARYYSPELQRFISEDPLRFRGGDVNFYAYVGNNPIMMIDSFGLACTLVDSTITSTVLQRIEKIVHGDWIFDRYQQINVFCICFFHRDNRVDVYDVIKKEIRKTFVCTQTDKCGNESTYTTTSSETQIEEKFIMSKYGGRELKRIYGTMYGIHGKEKSGGGYSCEPIGPPPGGIYGK